MRSTSASSSTESSITWSSFMPLAASSESSASAWATVRGNPSRMKPPATSGWSSRSDNMPMTIRSEEHTSELQSLMRISYAVFCLKNKQKKQYNTYYIYYNTYTQTQNT